MCAKHFRKFEIEFKKKKNDINSVAIQEAAEELSKKLSRKILASGINLKNLTKEEKEKIFRDNLTDEQMSEMLYEKKKSYS